MPDQTARDAVAGSIFNATFTAEWDDCPDGYQETRAMILRDADAILAALGIPPEMTASDVARAISTHVQTRAWQERVIAEQRDLTADQEDAT